MYGPLALSRHSSGKEGVGEGDGELADVSVEYALRNEYSDRVEGRGEWWPYGMDPPEAYDSRSVSPSLQRRPSSSDADRFGRIQLRRSWNGVWKQPASLRLQKGCFSTRVLVGFATDDTSGC